MEDLRTLMLNVDLLSKEEADKELLQVKQFAEDLVKYRRIDEHEEATVWIAQGIT